MARVAALAMRFERVRNLAFRTISQIGISYPDSPLSQNAAPAAQECAAAGDRFPWLQLKFDAERAAEDLFEKLDDTRFNLLVIGQPPFPAGALDEFRDLLRIHAVPMDSGQRCRVGAGDVPRSSFYLLRPDGHVGLCGERLEASSIKRYISERLHQRRCIPVGAAEVQIEGPYTRTACR